ncbi:MAG: YebC/PmpR family DNA-binding transcriptional regulator [Armatimonadetes bacterium]|nr:YebC/PmpR family DNA-binding transcriptional regulator [Armatimonadota bacterium]
MSGHSKWHNIKVKKQKMDQVRGKLFSKFSREISVIAKEGGSNPDANPRLRTAVDRARDAGMPNENIQRAIQRGAGELAGATYETVIYEGYAPGGVAILVEALTDNRNRTAAEIRSLFTKNNGTMAEAGSVAWQFEKKGLILVEKDKATEDDLMLAALDAGAEDIRTTDEGYEVVTAQEDFFKVKTALEGKGIPLVSADITMIAKTTQSVAGKEAQQVLRLVDVLEDHDDVQRVYSNFDIPSEILQQVG